MWTDQFQALLYLTLMAAMLRLSYDLSKPRVVASNPSSPSKKGEESAAVPVGEAGLTPQQAEWAEKAVRRYAESQERKWRRWSEAVFS